MYILDEFKDSAFDKSTPFPYMSTKPAHIYFKAGYPPYAQHIPTTIPLHLKEEVEQGLNENVANNIIEPVLIGEPVEWCSKITVVSEKDRQSLITIAQCQRETHHCQSPFSLPSTSKYEKDYFMQWMSTILSPWTKSANPSQRSSVSGADTTDLDYYKDTFQLGCLYTEILQTY